MTHIPKDGLLIFDCDGVLVDSEMIASRLLAKALTAEGFVISAAESRARFTGQSMASVVSATEKELGHALPDDFLDRLRANDIPVFEKELKAIPGIRKATEKLPQARCVASSGSPEKINHSLELTGLIDLFRPNLFSTLSVKNGKPAPDLFLYAAEQMGQRPADCIVVEDSPAGIKAGRAAQMTVFAFTGGAHVDPSHMERLQAAGPALLFDDMCDLPSLLGYAT